MIPIQKVDIYSSNGIKISAHVVMPNPQKASGAEALIYDPAFNGVYSTYQEIGRHADPQTAFRAIIAFSKRYIEKYGGKVTRIHNQCNTRFVSVQDQQSIVNALSLNLTVEANA